MNTLQLTVATLSLPLHPPTEDDVSSPLPLETIVKTSTTEIDQWTLAVVVDGRFDDTFVSASVEQLKQALQSRLGFLSGESNWIFLSQVSELKSSMIVKDLKQDTIRKRVEAISWLFLRHVLPGPFNATERPFWISPKVEAMLNWPMSLSICVQLSPELNMDLENVLTKLCTSQKDFVNQVMVRNLSVAENELLKLMVSYRFMDEEHFQLVLVCIIVVIFSRRYCLFPKPKRSLIFS